MTDRYQTIEVAPLTARVGAVVSGVDATEPMADGQFAEVEDALLQHGVLFFRDQDLTDEQQFAFADHFGRVNRSAFVPQDVTGKQAYIDWLEDTGDDPPKADLWHTDVAFIPEPPDYAILNCRTAPPAGGDTLWLSLYAVYESLSPLLQQFVDGLEVDCRPPRAEVGETDPGHKVIVYRPDASREGAVQPLVRVHPVTKQKALYMCGQYINGVLGLKPNESRALVELLRSQLDEPSVQCRWRWRANDLVIWDERCTNHRATSDHYPQHRLMRRCTVGGSRPVGPAA